MLCACALLSAAPARAISPGEIPDDLRRRLPEFILTIIPPQSLAYLSVADLEEYADAYEQGELHFVAECRVEQHNGPLSPELAQLVLQVPVGAPYIEARFERLAQRAYGQSIFTSLSWAIHQNTDGSVDVQLWYTSGDPEAWVPDIGYNVLSGLLYGVKYQNFLVGGRNRQEIAGLQLSAEDPAEPRVYGSWTDQTLNGGDNSYSLALSVGDDWRRRRRDSPEAADIRQRIAELDGSYSWKLQGADTVGQKSWGLQAGLFGQDSFVDAQASGFGTGPRESLDQAGTSGYLAVTLGDQDVDSRFTPRRGGSWRATAQQYVGDFDFSRLTLDARYYKPVRNLLGVEAEPADKDGCRQDVRRTLPGASLAVQAQAVLADGEVPFSQESRLGDATVIRGYPYDHYAGTKQLGLRGEYRFAVSASRDNDAFVFVDSALIGEKLDNLESLASYGAGATFKLPVFGVSAGLYYGLSFDGAESGYGFAVGYQF